LSAGSTPSFGAWYLGYIDLRATAVLMVGSWIGIRVAAPWIGRIPDQAHARIYLALLVIVLIAMVAR